MKAFVIILCLFSMAAGARVPIDDYSAQFLGKPYMVSPLGEGKSGAYDPDPLIRFDAFDCQTFVETMLARGDGRVLVDIRYVGRTPGFQRRHHFTDTWSLDNSNRISDVTEPMSLMVFGRPAGLREGIIDEAAWFLKIHNQEVDRPPRHVSTPYIPRAEILKNRKKFAGAVAEPMVVLFVIKDFSLINRLGTDLHVAHMGLLLPVEEGGLVLRHASSTAGKVADAEFFKYLDLLPPSYIGIQIFSIKD